TKNGIDLSKLQLRPRRSFVDDRCLQIKLLPRRYCRADEADGEVEVVGVAKIAQPRKPQRVLDRRVPVRMREHRGDDVRDVQEAKEDEELFELFVVAVDDEYPDEHGDDRNRDPLADVKERGAGADAGEFADDVAEVAEDEPEHQHGGDAEAELFADELAEALACDDAHARGDLLRKGEHKRHG